MIDHQNSQHDATRKSFFWMSLFFTFLILSCGGAGQETAPSAESWMIEQVLSQNQSQEVLRQTIEVKHCTVPEPKSIECPAGGEAQFTYALAATNFSPAPLDPGVASALGVGSTNTNSLDLPLPPQGALTTYEVVKRFSIVRGEAFARSSQGVQKNLAYTFVAACIVETRSQTTVDCETGQEHQPTPIPANTPFTPAATEPSLPTDVPTASALTPTPTPTSITIGQNCALDPAAIFANLWDSYRTLIGCPKSDLTVIPTIAEEAFQGGHLFWRNDTDQVYIIFDRRKRDGTELFEGLWELNPSSRVWDGSDPDGVGLNPPDGLVEPKRGFGWLWRNYLDREEGPLGWALDPEYGFDNTGQVQIFEQGLMFKGSTSRIYVLVNDGHFFAR